MQRVSNVSDCFCRGWKFVHSANRVMGEGAHDLRFAEGLHEDLSMQQSRPVALSTLAQRVSRQLPAARQNC